MQETLYRALRRRLHRSLDVPGEHDQILGAEHLEKVVSIDQEPIGRTPRSNPATYSRVMAPIRELFAQVPEARVRGYKPGRFSFNVVEGRCAACDGTGVRTVEMHMLPDVYVPCEQCAGTRYNRETLQIRYKGRNIAEVLELTVQEAIELFANVPKVRRILETLERVGLGYLQLGQSATTLSGGEAQRLKLARELARPEGGDTLYILDEPTTGLHMADIARLLRVLDELVEAGNTVRSSGITSMSSMHRDHIIDVARGRGRGGGWFATDARAGAREKASRTGQYRPALVEAPGERWPPDDRHLWCPATGARQPHRLPGTCSPVAAGRADRWWSCATRTTVASCPGSLARAGREAARAWSWSR